MTDGNITSMEPLVGELVGHHTVAGFIFLSYIISWVGTLTTLELLNIRTSVNGEVNWVLLMGSAFSMASLAIWSMHMFGNQAVEMNAPIQLQYNVGYMMASFCIPVGCALAAFAFTTRIEKPGYSVGGCLGIGPKLSSWIILFGCGTGVAAGICGMHYIGDYAIANYAAEYDHRFIAAAAFIAFFSSTTALGFFFKSRARWTNTWLKRCGAATGLALAVFGMHWTAYRGTSYRFKKEGLQNIGITRIVTMKIAGSIAGGALFLLVVMGVLSARKLQQSSRRAKKIVLAAAYFGPDGSIMVDGIQAKEMPSQMITRKYFEQAHERFFGTGHPSFNWIFRTSRNWKCIADVVDNMKEYLEKNPEIRHYDVPDGMSDRENDYSAAFKASFCVAAKKLSESLKVPLESLGSLHGDVLDTGVLSARRSWWRLWNPCRRQRDLEAQSQDFIGTGQLLFVVRHLSSREMSKMEKSLRCFVPIKLIANELAEKLSVDKEELINFLEVMQIAPQDPQPLKPGTYLGMFLIRYPVHKGDGSKLYVPVNQKNVLPAVPLREFCNGDEIKLGGDYSEALSFIENKSVREVRSYLERRYENCSYKKQWTDREIVFLMSIDKTVDLLLKEFSDQNSFCNQDFLEARYSSTCISLPLYGRNGAGGKNQVDMLVLRGCTDIHNVWDTRYLCQLSTDFFKCLQRVYPDSPDHDAFARSVHRDFSHFVQQESSDRNDSDASEMALTEVSTNPSLEIAGKSSKHCTVLLFIFLPYMLILFEHGLNNSTDLIPFSASNKLARTQTPTPSKHGPAPLSFAPIMVTNEIHVEDNVASDHELKEIQQAPTTRFAAGVEDREPNTWVDELMLTMRDLGRS
ncbi:MAG: hypothetical protein M1834_002004 [Cirrosporium novae-zelandiae]|nr:MAG: hypothetical protein M1834_002004 [Cirrosporium novae-zelandiae]